MNPLTMTDQELIEHASKQVQALRMALDMIECEKYDRRHVRWAIIDALKEEPAAPAQPVQKRPPNCGTGYCSCIECVMEPAPVATHYVDGGHLVYPTAQRTWVSLTDEQIDQGLLRTNYAFKTAEAWRDGVEWAMTQLKEKNAP